MAEDNKATTPSQDQPNEPLPWRIVPQKTSWPELVGVTAEEAKRKILEDMPGAQVLLVHPYQGVPQNLLYNRVWLYVDYSQKVWKTPTIG